MVLTWLKKRETLSQTKRKVRLNSELHTCARMVYTYIHTHHIHLCTHTHRVIHLYIHTSHPFMYTHTHSTSIYVYTHIHTYRAHTFMHTHIHRAIHLHTHSTSIYVYTHIHTQSTYIYTHTHTHSTSTSQLLQLIHSTPFSPLHFAPLPFKHPSTLPMKAYEHPVKQ